MKKIILTLMTCVVFHSWTFAQFSGEGSGTSEDPYQITNGDELFEVRNAPDAYFKLMNDIDLGPWIAEEDPEHGWSPIPVFRGNFDGNYKTIRGLYINRPNTNNIGLFNLISCNGDLVPLPEIKNLYIVEPHITGANNVGVIAGNGGGSGIIQVAIINPQIVGKNNVGTFVGSMSRSYRSINIAAIGGFIKASNYVGGIFGYQNASERCERLYSSVDIDAKQYAGGIVGATESHYRVITNPYSGIKTYYTSHSIFTNCRYDGKIKATKVVGGILGYAFSNTYCGSKAGLASDYADFTNNIFSGTLEATDSVNGMTGRYLNLTYDGAHSKREKNVCAMESIIVTGQSSVVPKRFAILSGTDNYASLSTVLIHKGQKLSIEDDEYNGTSYSLRQLKRKTTYQGFGYDFDETWAIVDGETLPYNFYQSTPAEVLSFVSGTNGVISGLAEGDGTVYVTINGKTIEGVVQNGKWEVDLGPIVEGVEAQVSVLTDNTLPSILTFAKAVSETEGGDIISGDPELDYVILTPSVTGNKGFEATLTVSLNNSQPMTSYSFDVELPTGISLEGYSLSNRHSGHYASVSYSEATKLYHCDVITLQNTEVSGNDGVLWSLKLGIPENINAGSYPVAIKHMRYTIASTNSRMSLADASGQLKVEESLRGDVNDDGVVNIADAVDVVNIIMNNE